MLIPSLFIVTFFSFWEYRIARREWLTQLPQGVTLNTTKELLDILSGNDAAAFRAAAQFMARARQTKRRQKLAFERLSSRLEATGFVGKRAAWRLKRKPCCRHGVFFTELPPSGCPCMSPNTAQVCGPLITISRPLLCFGLTSPHLSVLQYYRQGRGSNDDSISAIKAQFTW